MANQNSGIPRRVTGVSRAIGLAASWVRLLPTAEKPLVFGMVGLFLPGLLLWGSVGIGLGQPPQTEPATTPPAAQEPQPATESPVEWAKTEEGKLIVAPPDAGASVQMPVAPRFSERELVPLDQIPIHIRSWAAADEKGANFVFNWYDLPVPSDPVKIKNTLEGCVKGAVATTLGELESAEPIASWGPAKLPACEYRIRFQFREQPMRVSGRALLNGGRLYQLIYVAPEKEFSAEVAKQFFESFGLVPVTAEAEGSRSPAEPSPPTTPDAGDLKSQPGSGGGAGTGDKQE